MRPRLEFQAAEACSLAVVGLRDAQLAFQFIEDFKKNKALSRYTWTNPRPEVKGTTATFRAQGKLQ